MCENKWYKDHSLLIFNDEYLFVFNIYYHYGDTHLSCIGNDNFGVLTQNVFDVLFVTQTYRSFFLCLFVCFSDASYIFILFSPACSEIGLVMTLNK